VGFLVWRAENAKGLEAVLLTPTPLSGGPDGMYKFVDSEVEPGLSYWYWLEEASSGQRFGPQAITVPGGPAMQLRAFLPMVTGQ
jgi:hypothetical protein